MGDRSSGPSPGFLAVAAVVDSVITYGWFVVIGVVILVGVTQLLPWTTALLLGLAAALLIALSPVFLGFLAAMDSARPNADP